jgi:ribosomal-protein-alanine N-acetyltransferase
VITLRIEPVTAELVDRIVEIERQAFNDPWSVAAFRDVLANTRAWFQCARDAAGGAVVGYVVAWFVADEGEIANLAVADAARRCGVGAALLDAALAEADVRGARTMYLEVRDSNHGARALYASRAFEEVGRRKAYYRRPVEDAIILRR